MMPVYTFQNEKTHEEQEILLNQSEVKQVMQTGRYKDEEGQTWLRPENSLEGGVAAGNVRYGGIVTPQTGNNVFKGGRRF